MIFIAAESLPVYANASFQVFNQLLTTRLICRRFEDIPAMYGLYTYWKESAPPSDNTTAKNDKSLSKETTKSSELNKSKSVSLFIKVGAFNILQKQKIKML
jgi:hypothetical protein